MISAAGAMVEADTCVVETAMKPTRMSVRNRIDKSYKLTGGYPDWLRSDLEPLPPHVSLKTEEKGDWGFNPEHIELLEAQPETCRG